MSNSFKIALFLIEKQRFLLSFSTIVCLFLPKFSRLGFQPRENQNYFKIKTLEKIRENAAG
jgi:hypothetical protein